MGRRKTLKIPPPPSPAPSGTLAAELERLKARAYDLLAHIQQAQRALQEVNQKIGEVGAALEKAKATTKAESPPKT